uniref:NADH-ubiquinone oxidoreductase chain 5 n=1 Tax=Apoderinae sp. 2 AV-2018 TaxID=2480750 RepID=A0A3G2JZB2_9CUCU|nr:NADH dehydrogenase subunit 5 [Apoderinae sp. 2 AV-2018]
MSKSAKIFGFMFFIMSLFLFIMGVSLAKVNGKFIIEYVLLNLHSSSIVMTILLDWMSLLFLSFVLFISSMVIFYSLEYMGHDFLVNRFILLVVMFVVSMMLMIVSPNLISILLGWDGLGLVSYVLVIYYQNLKSFSAGMLTALTNRIGDVALLMSIAWMLNYGSWNFMCYLKLMKEDSLMGIIAMLVILASMTKSAQIPFSSWLPAAMAAPTPVSALVHSSTLVTAGVYLLIRFNSSFTSGMSSFLLLVSMMTMFMSGVGANFEFDLKKIIALSTLSQLGLMLSVLALGSYNLAFLHLLTHALFKAMLFLCAGVMIHSQGDNQDIRMMGGMIKKLPMTCSLFNICNFSLCGLPFFSGFYSKDLIIESLVSGEANLFVFFIFYVSVGCTVAYSFRLSFYSLSSDMNMSDISPNSENFSPMVKAMLCMIGLVVMSGSILLWSYFPNPYFITLTVFLKISVLLTVVIGLWLGHEISKFYLSYKNKSNSILGQSLFLASMWYMPILSTLSLSWLVLSKSENLEAKLDQGWGEDYGSKGLFDNLKSASMENNLIFVNNLKICFLLLVFWVIFLLCLL